jgi:predicted nuclease with TOPRIM domain
MDEQNHNQNSDYQHGYMSGIEGLDREAYESYVSSNVNHDWILDHLNQKRDELSSVRARHDETIQKHKLSFDKLQDQAMGVNNKVKRIAELETSVKQIDQESDNLREKRANKAPDYSLIAGLIFLAAGISFIAGDLIISHEIVAYALNIRNPNEAWAFAIGLAMLSVLLKPAYDRLVEDPYHDDTAPKGKSRYAKFKLILSVFAIVTLVILGWFRYEAYRTDKLKEAINKSVKNLQLNAVDPLTGAPVNSPELTNKIEEALRNSDQLNLDLVNSPWALLSFVLSGVLFAIAGAVSLGMALPVLQGFWYRWLQIDPKLWRLKRRKMKIEKQLEAMHLELSKQLAEKNILENDLSLLPAFAELKKEENELRNEIVALEKERRQAMTDTRVNSFGDGYAHGKVSRDVMNEEEYDAWRNSHLTVSNLALRAKSNATTDRAVPRSRNTGLRPHQAIRKAITDRFDESNT